MDSQTLERINKYRNVGDWESVETETRALLEENQKDSDALRILCQAIEKLGRNEELPVYWAQMVELEDTPGATAKRLAQYYQDTGNPDGAIEYYHRAMASFLKTKNFDQIENVWLELVDLAPEPLTPFLNTLKAMEEKGQGKRTATLAQTLWPHYLNKNKHHEALLLIELAVEHGPNDEITRTSLIQALERVNQNCPDLDSILASTGLKIDQPLKEGYTIVRRLLPFSKGNAFRHPDWGVGIVQSLDVLDKKVVLDFQRRKGHTMTVELAERALEKLDDDDYRTIRVKTPARAKELVQEDPLFLARSLIKSFGGSATARQIKERVCGDIIEPRIWNRWWTDVQIQLKNDPYVAIAGGAAKTFTLRDHPATEEEDWLNRIDRVKNVFGKLDVIKNYLQQVKKSERDPNLLSEMARDVIALAKKQKKPESVVEVVYTLEDLESACDGFALDSQGLAVEPFASEPHTALKTIVQLRQPDHQARFAVKIQETQDEAWPEIFYRLLLSPHLEVRDELAKALYEAGHYDLLTDLLRNVALDPRQYVSTYTWLADRSLRRKTEYLVLDIAPGVLFERLLQLTDFLCDQAKRAEKEDADRLRKEASKIREIVKGGHFSVFHELLPNLDRGQAASIYRRASTNSGLDIRAREHITSRILNRFPDLFSVEEADTGIPTLLCLPATLRAKQELLERISKKEIPAVTREMEIARQMGDLRENAEYHAARDRIRLLSAQAAELQEQLSIARAVPPEEISTERVGFGTKITLQSGGGEKSDNFYLLGPWESDPDRNILSIGAPFALPFLGKVVGDTVEVELAANTGHYTIVAIERFDPQTLLAPANTQTPSEGVLKSDAVTNTSNVSREGIVN